MIKLENALHNVLKAIPDSNNLVVLLLPPKLAINKTKIAITNAPINAEIPMKLCPKYKPRLKNIAIVAPSEAPKKSQ